jgi:hypothetical protein
MSNYKKASHKQWLAFKNKPPIKLRGKTVGTVEQQILKGIVNSQKKILKIQYQTLESVMTASKLELKKTMHALNKLAADAPERKLLEIESETIKKRMEEIHKKFGLPNPSGARGTRAYVPFQDAPFWTKKKK